MGQGPTLLQRQLQTGQGTAHDAPCHNLLGGGQRGGLAALAPSAMMWAAALRAPAACVTAVAAAARLCAVQCFSCQELLSRPHSTFATTKQT
jgi:hypothetical protein